MSHLPDQQINAYLTVQGKRVDIPKPTMDHLGDMAVRRGTTITGIINSILYDAVEADKIKIHFSQKKI